VTRAGSAERAGSDVDARAGRLRSVLDRARAVAGVHVELSELSTECSQVRGGLGADTALERSAVDVDTGDEVYARGVRALEASLRASEARADLAGSGVIGSSGASWHCRLRCVPVTPFREQKYSEANTSRGFSRCEVLLRARTDSSQAESSRDFNC